MVLGKRLLQLAGVVFAGAVSITAHAQGMSFSPQLSDDFWRSFRKVKIDDRMVPVSKDVSETLRRDAAARLSCDDAGDEVAVRWVHLAGWHGAYTVFADGCGERIVYGYEAPAAVSTRDYLQLYTLSRVSLESGR